MNDKQKRMAVYGVGGFLALYLLYRWYAGRSQAATAQSADSGTGTNPDYASLAGQTQADEAALQNQESQDVSGLSSQIAGLQSAFAGTPTYSDIAGLQSSVAATGAQEQMDVGALQGQLSSAPTLASLQGQFSKIFPAAWKKLNQQHVGAVKGKSAPHRGQPKAQPKTKAPNPHSPVHQNGNSGKSGTSHAGGAVAPRSNSPKPRQPVHTPRPAPRKPAPAKKRGK